MAGVVLNGQGLQGLGIETMQSLEKNLSELGFKLLARIAPDAMTLRQGLLRAPVGKDQYAGKCSWN